MPKVNPIPKGMAGTIPHLVVDKATEAIDFYKKAFDATELFRAPAPDGERLMHAELKIGEACIYVCDEFPEQRDGKLSNPKALGGCTTTIHRYVQNCDNLIDKAEKAGAKVVMRPQDMFWGDRYGVVEDPFGHRWSFATHFKDVTPEEMAEAAKNQKL
ncbi:MAG: VOC family protein [candidate division Zixibacteria bacterium]